MFSCFDICKSRVDFLILGFLLIKINELGIILLFSIWFNLFKWVLIWGVFLVLIFWICWGWVIILVKVVVVFLVVGVFVCLIFLIKVFYWL